MRNTQNRNTQNLNTPNLQAAASFVNANNDVLLCDAVDHTHAGVDTCVWLMEPPSRQEAFFHHLDAAQQLSGKVVWTNEEVIAEIHRKESSPRPGLAEAAHNALRQIDRMISEGRLIIYEAATDGPNHRKFADAAFLSLLIRNTDVPVTLITLDGDLAEDALNLKEMHSIDRSLAKIDVYRVNTSGNLSRFDFVTTADGKYFNPKNSPLQADDNAQMSQLDNTYHEMPDANEGDMLFSTRGNMFKIGKEINNGGESDIYEVEGCPDMVAKIFTSLSDRKEAKCRLLCRIAPSFPCSSAVLPLDLLFDVDGRFRGYVMKRIHGVELTRMLTCGGQKKHVPNWNRRNFAQLAASLADCFRDLSWMGLNIVDVSPGNVLIGYDDSGVLNPEKIFFIDLDSAQFGGCETDDSQVIVYPADGLTSEYAPPECLRMGFNSDRVLSRRNLVFGAAILCMQICMSGIHPYRKIVQQEGQTLSLPESIAEGAFPYSAGTNARMAMSPDGAEKLWSNLSSEMKRFFYNIFQQGGLTNAIEKRPSFFMLSKTLHNYVKWLEKPETLQRYPEVLCLMPSALKPFYTHCASSQCRTPEKEFTVTVFRSDGRYFCEECRQRILSKRNAEAGQSASHRGIPVASPGPEEPAQDGTLLNSGLASPDTCTGQPTKEVNQTACTALEAIKMRKIFSLD